MPISAVQQGTETVGTPMSSIPVSQLQAAAQNARYASTIRMGEKGSSKSEENAFTKAFQATVNWLKTFLSTTKDYLSKIYFYFGEQRPVGAHAEFLIELLKDEKLTAGAFLNAVRQTLSPEENKGVFGGEGFMVAAKGESEPISADQKRVIPERINGYFDRKQLNQIQLKLRNNNLADNEARAILKNVRHTLLGREGIFAQWVKALEEAFPNNSNRGGKTLAEILANVHADVGTTPLDVILGSKTLKQGQWVTLLRGIFQSAEARPVSVPKDGKAEKID